MMSTETRRLARHLRQRLEGMRISGVTELPVRSSPGASQGLAAGAARPDAARLDVGAFAPGASHERLERLARDVQACRRCPLYRTRTHAVISDGTPKARLMFIGEAPGRDEDLAGVPFVGRAGQLLTKMIEAIGMKREAVYICNILKDRPPANRTPLPEEMEACFPFLQEQMSIVQPDVICTMGAVATKVFLGPDISITKVRGQVREYQGMLLVPTFHPAYLLRNPAMKRFAWVDLKIVKKLLAN